MDGGSHQPALCIQAEHRVLYVRVPVQPCHENAAVDLPHLATNPYFLRIHDVLQRPEHPSTCLEHEIISEPIALDPRAQHTVVNGDSPDGKGAFGVGPDHGAANEGVIPRRLLEYRLGEGKAAQRRERGEDDELGGYEGIAEEILLGGRGQGLLHLPQRLEAADTAEQDSSRGRPHGFLPP